MPRPERPLDPAAGPVEALAAELRRLRRRAGNPGYRQLAARSDVSVTALANAAGGRQLPTLAVTLNFVRACGGDRDAWTRRWRQAAAELAARERQPPPEPDPAGAAPYRGLAPYDVDDADWFFGRDRTVRALTELLRERRFLAVFGVSGSGKTSLLRAGLIPSARETLAAAPVLITPGREPVSALRGARADAPGTLLVVDQFEELFTLCRDAAARDAFVTDLAALADGRTGHGRVVIGVRADFFGHCAELPQLATMLSGANSPIGPLRDDELREVIVGPARRAGHTVERALVTRIVDDVADQPGALPLVSHALLETWCQRRSDLLTLAGYEAAGGIAGAVAQTAEAVYHRFDDAQRRLVRQVMTRLVNFGEGVPDTRRRIRRAELDAVGAETVLQELAAARLVVLGDDTVEIAHEALISAWPRLDGWLHADEESTRRHRELTDAAAIWVAHGRDPGTLYRGVRLAQWDGRDTEQLNAVERAFLATSRTREDRAFAARRRRSRLLVGGLAAGVAVTTALAALALVQKRQAETQRDVAFSRQLVAAARDQSRTDQEVALLLAMEAYDVSPTQEARAALRQAFADSRVRAVRASGHGPTFGVAYHPDGRRFVSTGADGAVRVWDRTGRGGVGAGPRILRGHAGQVWSPVFSPDGRWLATCGVDHTVAVWDLSSGRPPLVLRGHAGVVSNVALAPDGRRVASASADGTVRLWDRTGRAAPVVVRFGSRPLSVAYSPDGRRLAVGAQDGSIRVADAAGFAGARTLTGHEGSVEDLEFGPDGRLASASSDGTVRVWPAGGGAAPVVLRGDDGYVESVAFSPDGTRVVSTHSGSNTVRVWSSRGGSDPLVLRGHDGPVWSAAFSPDGRRLASGSSDGTVRFWDPALPGTPLVLRGHDGPVWSVAAGGGRLVSGGADGRVRVWDPARPAATAVLPGHRSEVLDVALDAGGRRAASAGQDGSVRLWDPAAGGPTAAPVAVLTGHDGAVMSVDLSADGRWAASAGADGTVRIWDAEGRRPPRVLTGHRGTARSVAFSPDGTRVASSGADGTVRLWDVTGGSAPVVLRIGVPGLVWTVGFSPDGALLASGGHDGRVLLWPAAGSAPPRVLRGHRDAVWTVAFSADGTLLAGAGQDRAGVRVWRVGTGREVATYRGHNASVETVAFLADGRRLVSAHDDGTVRVWACEVCAPIAQIRARAAAHVTRGLTAQERADFLGAPQP